MRLVNPVTTYFFCLQIDESCIAQHRNERRVRTLDDDSDLISLQGGEPSLSGDMDQASVDESKDGDICEDPALQDSSDSESEDSLSVSSQENEGSAVADDSTDDFSSDIVPDHTGSDHPGLTTLLENYVKRGGFQQDDHCMSDVKAEVKDECEFPDTSIHLRYIGGEK